MVGVTFTSAPEILCCRERAIDENLTSGSILASKCRYETKKWPPHMLPSVAEILSFPCIPHFAVGFIMDVSGLLSAQMRKLIGRLKSICPEKSVVSIDDRRITAVYILNLIARIDYLKGCD